MSVEQPNPWRHDAADIKREELKRKLSPASFFYSQGRAIALAASYFDRRRLSPRVHAGVAMKHMHRIHLAMFGQLMASLEFLLKDFVARVIDVVPIFDEALIKADWLRVDTARILSIRSAVTTAGALLLHPTIGWQQPEMANRRYKDLFSSQPILPDEVQDLDRLWILRHSVAHNAGFVSAYDAARAGFPHIADKVADIDEEFILETFDFLARIAERVAQGVGETVLCKWLASRKALGPNYARDKDIYTALKLLSTFVDSRAQDLPRITKGPYTRDFARV
jgi:hypothetical protein